MRHAALARVYAEALVELAVEKGELDALAADLRALGPVLGEAGEARDAFLSPRLGSDAKRRLLEALCADAASGLTLSFLLLLTRKHREAALPFILEMFKQILDQRAGRVRGRIVSARQLSGDQVGRLESALGKATKAEVKLEVDTDSELLAGMVLQMEGRTLDGSLRTQLRRMKDRLLTADSGKE